MLHQYIPTAIGLYLLSASALVAAAQPSTWPHTTYSNGVTTVEVIEEIGRPSRYTTVVQGQAVYGWLRLDHIHAGKTYTDLSGTFMDTCTGQIKIRRPNRQSGRPMTAQVTWIVTRQSVDFNVINPQQGCNVPKGQQFQLTLPEALPQPDRHGEFTNANSTTFFADGDFSTWTQWQVTAADGAINCRDRPDGKVQRTYRQGQIIGKMGRENKNLVEVQGNFWLRTKDRCYIRANQQFIKPVSLPSNRW